MALYCAVIAVLAVPTVILIPNALAQAAALTSQAPTSIDRLRAAATGLEPASLRDAAIGLIDQANAVVRQPAAPRGEQVVAAGTTIVRGVIDFLTVFVLAYVVRYEPASSDVSSLEPT